MDTQSESPPSLVTVNQGCVDHDPKRKWYQAPVIAVGITPTGYIAVGVAPMGVVAIGVVPMGVISIGAVAMGALSAGVVSMGILAFGEVSMSKMGGHQGGGIHHPVPTQAKPMDAQNSINSKPESSMPGHNMNHH